MESAEPIKENSLKEISSKLFQSYEKKYIFSDQKMDFGKYLKSIEINTFDRIFITIKEGNYFWNEYYKMPQNTYINISGENYNNKGENNKVTITINQETYPCNSCTLNNHFSLTKLLIQRDCTTEFNGIDFIEFINPPKNLCPGGGSKGVFVLYEDNSRLYFLRTNSKISTSPFINVYYLGVGKIFFGHTTFSKNTQSKNEKIIIVDTNAGWNFKGHKAIVSCDYVYLDQYCSFDKNNKRIEYLCD